MDCVCDYVISGVVARRRAYLPYIRKALSPEAVAKYFAHLLEASSTVERCALYNYNYCYHTITCHFVGVCGRFELPGIAALNFVLTESLGGGGVSSLRIDPQVLD